MWIMTIEGALIGLLISAVASSPEKALHLFPLALIPQLLLAGLFIPVTKPTPFFPKVIQEERRIELQELPDVIVPRSMSNALRYGISPFMVGRWGLESLADLYIHDLYENPDKPYAYSLLNTITVSLHPDEAAAARAHLSKVSEAWQQSKAPDSLGGGPSSAMPWYLAILGLFMAVTVFLTSLAVRRTDSRG